MSKETLGRRIIAYAAAFLFAWPALLLFRRLGLANAATVLVGGALIGCVVGLMFDMPDVKLSRWTPYAAEGAAGLCSAAVFLWVWGWRANHSLKRTRPGGRAA
jgi:protein-S-isoprenylcysteine O-methyltransferase Ste14